MSWPPPFQSIKAILQGYGDALGWNHIRWHSLERCRSRVGTHCFPSMQRSCAEHGTLWSFIYKPVAKGLDLLFQPTSKLKQTSIFSLTSIPSPASIFSPIFIFNLTSIFIVRSSRLPLTYSSPSCQLFLTLCPRQMRAAASSSAEAHPQCHPSCQSVAHDYAQSQPSATFFFIQLPLASSPCGRVKSTTFHWGVHISSFNLPLSGGACILLCPTG